MAIFTAIGAAIGGALFGAGTLAASIAGSVISFGLSTGVRLALAYRNRPKPQAQTAIRGSVRTGAGVDCAILLGEDKVKGHLQYYAKWGAGNARNAFVKKLADGWCEGLAPYVYLFGEKVDLVSQTPVGNEHARYTLDGYGNAIVIRFYDGRPFQQADSELVAATAGLDAPWKATSRGTNNCYVVEDLTYNAGAFTRGMPEITYVLRGLREYDPRKDSTVSGGSGSHRLDDRSTWEFSQNNAVHRINYLLGHRGLISGEVMVGVGKEIDEIDLPMHMLAANVCDTERTVGGRTIPTYHCNQWASAGDDHLAILKNIEDAMAGYAVNASGLDGVLAGAPQIPVREISAKDIRADGDIKGKNRRRDRDGFNVLSGQYSSKETGFEPEGLKTVSVNADVALDGGKRLASNDFLQVSDADIAQYLLNIRYRQNRKAKRRLLPVSRELAMNVRLGEWVTYEGIDWMVAHWGFDRAFRFSIDLVETGSDVYAEEGIEPGPVIVPVTAPVNPSLISTVTNFTVTAGLIEGVNGAQIPALEFNWDDPEDPTITEVRIVYRKVGTSAPELTATATDVASGTLIVTQGLQSGTSYEARATISTRPDRLKTYTSWVAAATATVPLQVMLAEVAEDVAGTLAGLRADLNNVRAHVTDLADTLSGSAATNRLTLGRVQERVDDAQVAVSSEIRTRTTETEAIGVLIDEIDATLITLDGEIEGNASAISATQASVTALGGVVSSLSFDFSSVEAAVNNPTTGLAATASGLSTTQAEVSDLDGVVTALSIDVTAVEALSAAGTASGLLKWEAVSAPAGVSARFSLFGQATAGGTYRDGGARLDITPTSARWAFFSDQFSIMKPDGTLVAVFGEDAGDLVIQNIRVGTVTFDQLSSANGKLVLKGSGSLASIEVFS